METKINKIEVTTKEQLAELYNESAFTIEGLNTSKENLEGLIEWLNKYGGVKETISIFIIKGSVMNNEYGLTENNAYPNDLNIVSIKLKDIKEVSKVAVSRFAIGARWFDDIVNNNAERQNRIDGVEEEEN